MIVYASIALVLLLTILAIALSNVRSFPRLAEFEPVSPAPEPPFISILIPARNEAEAVAATVSSLLHQNYVNFELLLLDDGSSDETVRIATEAAASLGSRSAVRFSVASGASLPCGWTGKNWACSQLAEQARGSILVFTDADVTWAPGALSALWQAMEELGADLLTVWPTQETQTLTERLVVPMMAFSVLGYLPLRLVHDTPYPRAAAANGQCLAFRRVAYDATGGHGAVAGEIVEDIRLAQRAKAAGLQLRMADASGLIRCRMYHNWIEVRDGFAKNILAGHDNSIAWLILSTVFHLALFVFPWFWLGWESLRPETSVLDLVPWLLILLGMSTRAVTARATGQRTIDALLLPVSVLLLTCIAARSIWWRLRCGGPHWKDRTLKNLNGGKGSDPLTGHHV